MSRLDERISEQFRNWEERGRGWQVFPMPVYPEPPFCHFDSHYLLPEQKEDDGRKSTFLSSFVERLRRKLSAENNSQAPPPIPEAEPGPQILSRSRLVELQASLPAGLEIGKDAFQQFLCSLALFSEPVAFELVGREAGVTVQFAASEIDSSLLSRQLEAHCPGVFFLPPENALEQLWDTCVGDDILIVEFGLAREFMFPLATGKNDPFIGLVGSLGNLQEEDLVVFQVLFQAAHHPWADSIKRSVTHADGKPFFINVPELAKAAESKIAQPLFAAVARIACRTANYERTLQLARDIAAALRVFGHPQGNHLIPLRNDDYPFENHVDDLLLRQSRRSGMLLNSEELVDFVHLPSKSVTSPALLRQLAKTKAAPPNVRHATGLLLGDNLHLGQTTPVRLPTELRLRHVHIVGASGTGKTTLLFNLIRQDIEQGQGVAVFDPHGDLIEQILSVIPTERVQDVILIDPANEEYSIGFNMLAAHTDVEKNLLASDLVSVFQRLSTSWGDQMGSVLHNAILVFLESSRRGTLADLRRFLAEPAFRSEFLETITDPALLYYWHKAFPQLSGNKSIGPVLTRLETFLAPKPIRYMVSQAENRLDFGHIMDSGKIFLAKLSQGLLGKENSYLLGTFLVSKFQQLAMARQIQQAAFRREFWLYIDEFHNFITPSMAEILSGARKYRLGLVLAHQELRQLQRDSDVASAVMSNPATRICFRVGEDDARKLDAGFSFFDACDLQNLERGQAIARVERSDFDFNLSVPRASEPDPQTAMSTRQAATAASQARYAVPRSEVEAILRKLWEAERSSEKSPAKRAISKQASTKSTQPAVEPPISPKPEPLPPPTSPIPSVPPSSPPSPAPSKELEPPTVSEKKSLGVIADLGRGGAQHQAIQKRIKEAAERLGFRSVIEKQVLDGKGSVDLLLERGEERIACEISISTSIDHEVGNVAKCIKAGYPKVAVVCLDEKRLQKISAAVTGSLGHDAAAGVGYFQPDQFIASLRPVLSSEPEVHVQPKMRRGYRVKKSTTQLSSEEQKTREAAAVRSIAEAMRIRST